MKVGIRTELVWLYSNVHLSTSRSMLVQYIHRPLVLVEKRFRWEKQRAICFRDYGAKSAVLQFGFNGQL